MARNGCFPSVCEKGVNTLFTIIGRDFDWFLQPCRFKPGTQPTETAMKNVIEFKPRGSTGTRRTYDKAADVIPMPVRKTSLSAETKAPTDVPTLSDLMDLTWPRATD